MANKDGKGKNKRRKSRSRLNLYFFIDDKLHKKLHINRSDDVITAWSYPDHKRVGYTYSTVLKNHQKAFSTREVCEMLNRKRTTIEMALVSGKIERPQFTYSLESGKMHKYFWREQDVISMWEYLSTVHRGRPRRDGLVAPQALPTKSELRAIMRQEEVLYVLEDGEFVPTWRAKDF